MSSRERVASYRTSPTRIAVVGGGASGLTLAWLLGEGFEVSVFERGAEVGGNWCTIERDGQNIEMGAVKVFEHNLRLRRLCELMGMSLTVDEVIPDGGVKWDDTFRIHYPHVDGKLRRGAMMGASFGYLVGYLGLYLGLEQVRRVRPGPIARIKLRHIEAATGLRALPRTVRETVRAFLWMGALTYNDIADSAFMGLMANVHNNFAGFGRHRIFSIDRGFLGLAKALRKDNPRARFECAAAVQRVRTAADGDGLEVEWMHGEVSRRERFDHVVFACPPWHAAQMLEVEGTREIRARLERFVNAPNKVQLHDDDAIVGETGVVQLTVNARAYYSSLRTGVRKLWKSYQSHPTPERFDYPRPDTIDHEEIFDTDAFTAVDEVMAMNSDAVQGVANTWYIHNAYHPSLVRNGEQAVQQAMGLCARLDPDSPRLASLRLAPTAI